MFYVMCGIVFAIIWVTAIFISLVNLIIDSHIMVAKVKLKNILCLICSTGMLIYALSVVYAYYDFYTTTSYVVYLN